MDQEIGKTFDFRLFKRVLAYTRPYRLTFLGVALAAILLSGFAVLTPLIVGEIIDGAIKKSDADKLWFLTLAMGAVLFGQVLCQLCFTY
ncbi:MAG: ABC transporter ATP-binding protein, partial [Flavobacteriaceae bacterium]|nr:ABC transporter ATP-binding protein [Flavobacteriaceae bacterium]